MQSTTRDARLAIELRALDKRFAGGRGVRALDLEVQTGEVFGFIGPNGAGKTTTIRAMLGLSRRSSGEAKVLGVDLERASADERRDALARVGYVPSEPGVYERQSVRDVLAFLGALHGGETRARRDELCERLDLDPARRADELSLGNKKKLALVAAMQHRPALLVLDEPSNGLDPLVQRTLFDLLREERSRGATVFFSSHVLSEVERFCDRFALLRDGALARVLTADELLRSKQRRVRAEFTPSGVEASALVALSGRRPDRDGRVEFVTDAPMRAVFDAVAEDVREGRLADVTVDHPSLEELVLDEYQSTARREVKAS
ncbi:MAG: ABC transporter ATP-binding protein [Myxococcales bacterium]|nr:ABC transporter ATP-binding protein [Myxococcales bacterium]